MEDHLNEELEPRSRLREYVDSKRRMVAKKLCYAKPTEEVGGRQPPSFPWHAKPQSHEIQDFLFSFLLIFHQFGFLQRILRSLPQP